MGLRELAYPLTLMRTQQEGTRNRKQELTNYRLCGTLISNFQPGELGRIMFLSMNHSTYGSLLQQIKWTMVIIENGDLSSCSESLVHPQCLLWVLYMVYTISGDCILWILEHPSNLHFENKLILISCQ